MILHGAYPPPLLDGLWVYQPNPCLGTRPHSPVAESWSQVAHARNPIGAGHHKTQQRGNDDPNSHTGGGRCAVTALLAAIVTTYREG